MIVIIGILVAITLPNFIAAEDRAKLASVKSNARYTIYGLDKNYIFITDKNRVFMISNM
jgi:type II secretory pathway pseudopilin PulG